MFPSSHPRRRLYPGVCRVRISPVILDEIYRHKLCEVEENKERISLSRLEGAIAGLSPANLERLILSLFSSTSQSLCLYISSNITGEILTRHTPGYNLRQIKAIKRI